MNLCLSNLAWDQPREDEIFNYMKCLGIQGVEIAPTKLFGDDPYNNISDAVMYSGLLRKKYSVSIASMQSIWYGRKENIFGSPAERERLLIHTKKAIDFSAAIGCHNLVFGCPKNRIMSDLSQKSESYDFFSDIGKYAAEAGTFVSVEPNPEIYGTNFLNTSIEAIEFCRQIDSKGVKVNLDFGTIIINREQPEVFQDNLDVVGHVHISEAYLKPLVRRSGHLRLRGILHDGGYQGFISVEMGVSDNHQDIFDAAYYLKEVFG